MTSARTKAYLLLTIVSIIWGLAGPIIKFTLQELPPLIFLSYRFTLSTIFALIYFAFRPPQLPNSLKLTGYISLYSLLAVTFGLGLLFFGFDKTTSLVGTVISALAPLATVVAGAFLLHEHVTRREQVGISLASAGTVIIIFSPLLANSLNLSHLASVEGGGLILASVVLDALAAIMIKVILRHGFSPTHLTHYSFIIGWLTLVPVTLLFYPWSQISHILTTIPLSTHLGVWYMALLSGTLAYSLRNLAIKTIEVSEAVIFSYLFPIWAAPLSLLWLGETINFLFVAGATTIAAGVYFAERRPQKLVASG